MPSIATTILTINWNSPWLLPYRPYGERLAAAIALGSPVHQALNDAIGSNSSFQCPVRFVEQLASEGAAAYESFIWQTRTVPTRDNLHDFFNGLVWLRFPKIKARLNALQASAIEAAGGITPHRGRLRDALTLFDENAALLLARPAFRLALQHKDWQALFVRERPWWSQTQLVLVGHALIEKLVQPRKNITAHVFDGSAAFQELPDLPLDLVDLDAHIAQQLSAEYLAQKPFMPLPVMGVPAWCEANADPAFYDDADVFRSRHPQRPSNDRV